MQEMGTPYGVAISDGTTVRGSDGTTSRILDVANATSVARAAHEIGVHAVFIVPFTALSRAALLPEFAAGEQGWTIRTSGPAGDALPTTHTAYRGDDRVVIMHPAADSRWDMLRDLPADDLLDAVASAARSIQITPAYSPGQVARHLLDASTREKLWLRPLTVDLPRLRGQSISWLRPFAPIWKHIHLYDINAAYLATAMDQDLGVGDPIEYKHNRGALPTSRYAFGLVKARIIRDCLWDGYQLPSPFGAPAPEVRGWFAMPQIRFAQEVGWSVSVLSVLEWPERHRLLRTWADRLWHARVALTTDRALYPNEFAARRSASMMKRAATMGIGLFGHEPGVDDDASLLSRQAQRRFFRPDWRVWIMSECYRRRLAEIKRYADAGAIPAAADTDMLAILSDEPDPAKAAPGILTRPAGLGGYKHLGTISDQAGIDQLSEYAASEPIPTPARWMLKARELARP